MSKHTTTLMEIIQSELQNKGHNEFVNNGRLSFYDNEYTFIQKVLQFDDDVKKIVDHTIFKGFKFNDERIDRYFKEAFTTRFLDREIGRQTVESFASQVLYQTIVREDYIFTIFGSEVYKYLENHVDYDMQSTGTMNENEIQNTKNEQQQTNKGTEKNKGDVSSKGSNISSDRELSSTLPQSQINLNVDNDTLAYGDNNNISKNKTNTTNDEKSNSNRDTTGETNANSNEDSKRDTEQDTTGTQKSLQKTYLLENLDKIYTMREKLFNDYDKKCFLQIW